MKGKSTKSKKFSHRPDIPTILVDMAQVAKRDDGMVTISFSQAIPEIGMVEQFRAMLFPKTAKELAGILAHASDMPEKRNQRPKDNGGKS